MVTGATGFLGSRITQQLIMNTKMTVIGAPSQIVEKGPKLRQALEEADTTGQHYNFDRLELHETDMLQDYECYYKLIKEVKPHYVIHTACPFISAVITGSQEEEKEINGRIKAYVKATRLLAKSACANGVRKIVMTGAATSVIGKAPRGNGVYDDSKVWAYEAEM